MNCQNKQLLLLSKPGATDRAVKQWGIFSCASQNPCAQQQKQLSEYVSPTKRELWPGRVKTEDVSVSMILPTEAQER